MRLLERVDTRRFVGKVRVEKKVISVKRNGTVIIVKIEREDKKKVMRNKHKLKERNVFIENESTWEESEGENI